MGITDRYKADVDATVDEAEVFTAQPNGKVSATLAVTGDATYDLEVSEDGSNWVQYHTYTAPETVEVAAAHVRLTISTAGTGTDEVYWALGDDS